MTTFGERFKELRKELGMTQEELATKFYTTKSSISRYENNENIPEINTLQSFADFFDVSVDYLLGRTDIRYHYDKNTETLQNDPELQALWNKLKERPDLQLLFKQIKDVDSKGIQQIIRIIKAIENDEA